MIINIDKEIDYLEYKMNETGLSHSEMTEYRELLKIKYEGVL